MRNVYMVDGPQMMVLIGMSQQYWQIGYWIPFQSLIEWAQKQMSFSDDLLVHIVRMFEHVHQTPASFNFVEQTQYDISFVSHIFVWSLRSRGPWYSVVLCPPGIGRTEGGAWNYSHEDAIDWDQLQEDLKHYTGDLETEKHREIEEMEGFFKWLLSIGKRVCKTLENSNQKMIGQKWNACHNSDNLCNQKWTWNFPFDKSVPQKALQKVVGKACCEWIARQSHLYGGLVGESSNHEIDPGSPPGRHRAPGKEFFRLKFSGPLRTIEQFQYNKHHSK